MITTASWPLCRHLAVSRVEVGCPSASAASRLSLLPLTHGFDLQSVVSVWGPLCVLLAPPLPDRASYFSVKGEFDGSKLSDGLL